MALIPNAWTGFDFGLGEDLDRLRRSVAAFARPILPKTVATSGTLRNRRSICWSTELPSVSDMPGGDVGM